MLTPSEIAAIIAATNGAVDLFDKFAGQIKSVLMKRPKETEGKEDRWKIKIGAEDKNIVVKNQSTVVQTISGDQLAKMLNTKDLSLIQSYEQKMNEYFDLWRAVYAQKDSSADPLVNAKTELQLKNLIVKMRNELLGILGFLQRIGVHLDDHYMHIRGLVESTQ